MRIRIQYFRRMRIRIRVRFESSLPKVNKTKFWFSSIFVFTLNIFRPSYFCLKYDWIESFFIIFLPFLGWFCPFWIRIQEAIECGSGSETRPWVYFHTQSFIKTDPPLHTILGVQTVTINALQEKKTDNYGRRRFRKGSPSVVNIHSTGDCEIVLDALTTVLCQEPYLMYSWVPEPVPKPFSNKPNPYFSS
jgi:hypothetical protein